MPESEWSEELAEPPKKGIPIWVWGCGGCGLISMIAIIAVAVFGMKFVEQATDPEIVWANIDEILPFDERPEGYEAIGASIAGFGGYGIWSESNQLGAALFDSKLDEGDEVNLDDLFDGGALQRDNQFGMSNVKEATPITLLVDGRECKALSFRTSDGINLPGMKERTSRRESWGLLINLTQSERRVRIVEIIDLATEETEASAETAEGEDPEPTAQARGQALADRFFAPFTPWAE